MKRIALTIACALASGIGGLALAQQPSPEMQPSQQPPPGNYQTTPPPATTPPDAERSGAATTSSDRRTLMKDCMAQQEQQRSSTGMSKHDMKKYCKSQVKSSTESQPH